MILQLEFDSLTLPHTTINKIYDIPNHQKDLIEGIYKLFNATQKGTLILPIKVSMVHDDKEYEMTMILSTVSKSLHYNTLINPKQKIQVLDISHYQQPKETLVRKFIKWIQLISASLIPL